MFYLEFPNHKSIVLNKFYVHCSLQPWVRHPHSSSSVRVKKLVQQFAMTCNRLNYYEAFTFNFVVHLFFYIFPTYSLLTNLRRLTSGFNSFYWKCSNNKKKPTADWDLWHAITASVGLTKLFRSMLHTFQEFVIKA